MKITRRIVISLLLGSFLFTTPAASLAAMKNTRAAAENAVSPKAAPSRPPQHRPQPDRLAPQSPQHRPQPGRPAPQPPQNRPQPDRPAPQPPQHRPQPGRPAPQPPRQDRRPEPPRSHHDRDSDTALKVGGAALLLGLLLGSSQNSENSY